MLLIALSNTKKVRKEQERLLLWLSLQTDKQMINSFKTMILDDDFGIRKLKLLKNAMTKELDIPASIYEALFHWILFSSHALITAQMYSSNLRVSSFLDE